MIIKGMLDWKVRIVIVLCHIIKVKFRRRSSHADFDCINLNGTLCTYKLSNVK